MRANPVMHELQAEKLCECLGNVVAAAQALRYDGKVDVKEWASEFQRIMEQQKINRSFVNGISWERAREAFIATLTASIEIANGKEL